MTKTTNYQLNQWAKSDRVMMDDFNADNEKLEAVLAAHAAALAGCGNCKIEYGTYHGKGTHGDGKNCNKLTFSGQPLLVIVCCEVDGLILVMPYNSQCGSLLTMETTITGYAAVDWNTPNAVSWYHSGGARQQMNANFDYRYLALIAADAE